MYTIAHAPWGCVTLPQGCSTDEFISIFRVSYHGFGVLDLFRMIDLVVWFENLEEIWFQL